MSQCENVCEKCSLLVNNNKTTSTIHYKGETPMLDMYGGPVVQFSHFLAVR